MLSPLGSPQNLLGLLADVGQNAAIDVQDQAIDKVRSLGCQEDSGSAQILCLAPAACRGLGNDELGIDWLKKFRRRYKRCVWLNPIDKDSWEYTYGYRTIQAIKEVFPMFELTLDRLEAAIKKLLVK